MSILDLWNTVVEKQKLQEENGALRYDDDIRDYEKRSGMKMALFPLILLYKMHMICQRHEDTVRIGFYATSSLSSQEKSNRPTTVFSDYPITCAPCNLTPKDQYIDICRGKILEDNPSFYDEDGDQVHYSALDGSIRIMDPVTRTDARIRWGTAKENIRPIYIPLPASWLGDDSRCYCLTSDPAYTSYDIVCAIHAVPTRNRFKKILWSFVEDEQRIIEIPGANDRIGAYVHQLVTKLEETTSGICPNSSANVLRQASVRLKNIAVLMYRLSGEPDDDQLEELTNLLQEL